MLAVRTRPFIIDAFRRNGNGSEGGFVALLNKGQRRRCADVGRNRREGLAKGPDLVAESAILVRDDEATPRFGDADVLETEVFESLDDSVCLRRPGQVLCSDRGSIAEEAEEDDCSTICHFEGPRTCMGD